MPDILRYDAKVNRYRGAGVSYRPDKIELLFKAIRIFPTVLVDGKKVDNLQRQLDSLPAGADGIVVWPYEDETVGNEAEIEMVGVAPYRIVKPF